jgi:hypothetical protein
MPMDKGLIKGFSRQLKKANRKSAEITKISKIKVEILSVKREIEEKLLELGAKTYEQFKQGKDSELLSELPIRHLTEQLKELEVELKKYKRQLEQIKEESTLNIKE